MGIIFPEQNIELDSTYIKKLPTAQLFEIGRIGVTNGSEALSFSSESKKGLELAGEEPISLAVEKSREDIEHISFVDLETAYRKTHDHESEANRCGLMTFTGGEKINGLTGYNTTPPIYDVRYDPNTGKPYFILGVRMEKADDEQDSRIEYFRAATAFSHQWDHIDDDEGLRSIKGQDPYITRIGGQLLLDVVEVELCPAEDESPAHLVWRTAFYKGSNIRELEFFAYGPPGMKDIRPVELSPNKIINFTRPQNEDPAKGGRGQIGEVITDSIEIIKNPDVLQDAPLINTRFLPEEWGGINYGVVLKDEKVGVIGHIARFDTNNPEYEGQVDKPKIYHPFSGVYDPFTRKIANIEILAMADEFRGVNPKKKILKGVAYGTGITEPNEDGDVMLLLGVGDAVTGYKTIKDPFEGLRNLSA